MPSDERVDLVFQALAGQRDAFLAALGTTADQVDHYIAAHGNSNGTRERVTVELGPFAGSRIDAERFSSLFATASLDGRLLKTIQKARDTIRGLAALDRDLFLADVPSGGSLTTTVARALERIGLAFGAARVFDQARSGAAARNKGAPDLDGFAFPEWSRRERALAPPLVVTVDGADLRTGGLAEFLDGAQKIVLVVRGEAPPAPLVRLITPGTFVVQTYEVNGLDRFAAWDGPGVAALMPESAAVFTHDPAAGPAAWQRLSIGSVPAQEPTRPTGGLSVRQQAEELRQLTAMAEAARPSGLVRGDAGASAIPAGAVETTTDPVDKLAAWLLQQADLTDVS